MANQLIQLKNGSDNAYPNISDLFYVTSNPITIASIAIGGNSGAYAQISMEGYKPLAIVGWSVNNGNIDVKELFVCNNTTIYGFAHNDGSSTLTDAVIDARVLWIRSS